MRQCTLGDLIADDTAGFACGKSNIVEQGVVHLRPFNIGLRGEINLATTYKIPADAVPKGRGELRAGDILFNNTNSAELVGKAAIIESDICAGFSNHLTRIRVNKQVALSKYLLYVLLNLREKGTFTASATQWVSQAAYRVSDLKQLPITLPPLPEQQRIVDILDRAAAIQRLRRAAEEKAREIIPALFVDMFGDPATNPKGWEQSPMANLVKIRSSVVVPDLNVDGDLLCIGPDAISKDHGDIIAAKKVKDINPKSGKYKFYPGDVLYSKIRPSLRKATVVDELGYCSADMYAMIPSDRLTKEFLLYALLSDHFSQYAIGKSARAQMPKVNRGDIDQYRLIVPKLDLQVCFAERVRSIRDQYGLQNSSKSVMDDLLSSLSARFFGQT